jgi:putative ABC transport system ATP-binding protein
MNWAREASALAASSNGENPPLISARGVHKSYKLGEQSVRALEAVSFDIRAGEYVAIMGPSGSGKSTMMNLIGALDQPTAGELRIAGHDITRLSSDALAEFRNRTIGFVFQQFNLLPRTTALRQVMLPLMYAKPRAAQPEAMARARLEQMGLGERLDHGPQQLSGGQQQRVAIARALVNNPQLLLADEPTGALDSKTSEAIMQVFEELNRQGITIVLVTHDADVARHARRRILFRDGQVIEDAPQARREHASVSSALAEAPP